MNWLDLRSKGQRLRSQLGHIRTLGVIFSLLFRMHGHIFMLLIVITHYLIHKTVMMKVVRSKVSVTDYFSGGIVPGRV